MPAQGELLPYADRHPRAADLHEPPRQDRRTGSASLPVACHVQPSLPVDTRAIEPGFRRKQ
jgi:hypothetical protein